jgi:hypothetical protein
MSVLKQITKPSLLNPYEQFHTQSHCYHKELTLEQNKGENNPISQLIFNPHNIHQSILQHYQIPRLQHRTHSSTYKTALLMVHTAFWSQFIPHSETLYCISWQTVNVTSYSFMFSPFLSWNIIRFNCCVLFCFVSTSICVEISNILYLGIL